MVGRGEGTYYVVSGDHDDGDDLSSGSCEEKAVDKKKGRTVDCIENDTAPKAPIAGKKKKRSTDGEENEQGATKYLKYGKGIG